MVAAFQRLVSVVGNCSVDELMLEARVRNGQERRGSEGLGILR